MNVTNVSIKKLSGIGCNNPNREIDQSLKPLLESVKMYGILQPLLVDEKTMSIIDGHRRFRVAAQLGMETVPAILVSGNGDKHVLYAELNTASRPFSGADKLFAAATGGVKFSGGAGTSIKRMIDILGNERAIELSKKGHSAVLYQKAIRIARYCGLVELRAGHGRPLEPVEMGYVGRVIEWIVSHKMSRLAEAAIKDDINPMVLLDAINSNRGLELRWG